MSTVFTSPKPIVAALVASALISVAFSLPVKGQGAGSVKDLLDQLEQSEPAEASKISREIALEWSKSGSASMNLLLKRGKEAMERGEFQLAIGHLTALTDHAPDFAEGWAMRAQVWHRLEEPGLVLADLQQVLALNPNHYEALFGLAVTLEQLEQFDLAIRAYDLVLSIHPHYLEAQEGMTRLKPRVQGKAL